MNPLLVEIQNNLNLVIDTKNHKTGTYGTIYEVTKDDKKYIIKLFKEDITGADIINELSCLTALSKYQYFPKISSVFWENHGQKVAVLMNHCGSTIHHEYNQTVDPLSLSLQFIQIYNILHMEGIIHRDIKNNNICLNNGQLHLIDFGYSRFFPYISREMKVIGMNYHTESLSKLYDAKYSKMIDYMSIFHTIMGFFNRNTHNHEIIYPLFFSMKEDIITNFAYLLLSKNNTIERRTNIWRIINKTAGKLVMDEETFHTRFSPKPSNAGYFYAYQKLIAKIPSPLYRSLKKLINLNPDTRIRFKQFYHQVKWTYPQFDTIPFKERYQLIFDKTTYFDILNSAPDELKYVYQPDRSHPVIYALTFYRYFLAKNQFPDTDHLLLMNVIEYTNYTSMVANVYPRTINIHVDNEVLIKYMKFVNNNFHGISPFRYLCQMRFIRWSHTNLLLFSYFITIISTHYILGSIDPFIICTIVTTLVARMYQSIPISIDTESENMELPAKYNTNTKMIIVTKNNFRRFFLNNPSFMKLVNKFYGYYAHLVRNKHISFLKHYYLVIQPIMSHQFTFYDKQIYKYIEQTKEN